MRTILLTAAAAALLTMTSCGAPGASSTAPNAATAGADSSSPAAADAAASAPTETAQAPRVSTTPCQSSNGDARQLANFYSYSDNDPLAATGIAVDATPGMATCTGHEFAVTCQVRGPSEVSVSIQDSVQWRIPAGRSATVAQRETATTCFLNEP